MKRFVWLFVFIVSQSAVFKTSAEAFSVNVCPGIIDQAVFIPISFDAGFTKYSFFAEPISPGLLDHFLNDEEVDDSDDMFSDDVGSSILETTNPVIVSELFHFVWREVFAGLNLYIFYCCLKVDYSLF